MTQLPKSGRQSRVIQAKAALILQNPQPFTGTVDISIYNSVQKNSVILIIN
jgi:hypothetical protein